MIPLKLQIKNFLSYGNQLQAIDFEPHHLIALTGKNGHGKSALLDAITWALWGQARKITGTAKADSHLLRLGQTHMMVIFDFECNKQRYRIKREFTNTYGKPHASVEVGVYQHEGNAFIALTTKTIRETQEYIESMIGISYDSFINSAFLRQGNANEFSKKTPKERKEILASMLNLQIYESLRKIAVEKSKQAAITLQTVMAVQGHIAKDLEQLPKIKLQINDIQQQITHYNEREKSIKNELNKLIIEKNKLIEVKQELSLNIFQQEQYSTQEHSQQAILRSIHQEWRTINRQKKSYNHIQNIDKKRQALFIQLEEKQQLIQQHIAHKEKSLQLKEQEQELLKKLYAQYQIQIQQQQRILDLATIENDQKKRLFVEIQQQLQQLEEQQHTLVVQINQVNGSIATISDNTNSITIERQFEKRKAHYQKWLTKANVFHTELQQLDQKKQLTFDEHNPSCPLCEQNLSAARKKFLKTKYHRQEHFLHHRLKRLSTVLAQLKKILIDQHAQLEELKKQEDIKKQFIATQRELHQKQKDILATHAEMQLKLNTLTNELQRLEQIRVEQQAKLDALYHAEQHIGLHDLQLKAIKQALILCEEEIQKSFQSNQQYQEIKHQIEQLDKIYLDYNQFEEQLKLQQERAKKIHELCVALKTIKKSKLSLKESIEQLQKKLSIEKTIDQEHQKLELHFIEIQHKKELLLESKGSWEHQHKKLEQLEKEYAEHTKTVMQLQITIDDYAILSTIFGKDGIQALLIEDIIPEIEHETNNLLSQLTDGQSHITIESLRDLKKGGTKETLDIKISDPAGIRPYELFSGGEAFRIDFALRIAIAKLLARRSGTALQTLIIDEGFGSQDDEGLGHMMDAIYRIQDNFCKIIIVSHLPSMRDQFPVHFHVEKGPQGSIVNVIEQG